MSIDRCPYCSFQPTGANDYCDKHRPTTWREDVDHADFQARCWDKLEGWGRRGRRKFKKFTKAERKALGLDKMAANRYGEQAGRNPQLHEEPPIQFDPRGKENYD